MGGVIAVRLALAHPESVRRLVLVATSGGIDVSALGGVDWREEYRREFPRAATWVTQKQGDLTEALRQLAIPALLIWGDEDPISPPAVGERLAELLPDAQLHVIAGGTHRVAYEQPEAVASLIAEHLR
jgi:pimeloyl-ACP methyl ester carboxylesterase